MRGIILAGGKGTRLAPITLAISKQLIPVFNKPLIYYPLTTLMLAGVRDVLIITQSLYLPLFKNLLGNGSDFGINISYEVQENPNGIPDAIVIGRDFIGDNDFFLILGDNLFYGPGIGRSLRRAYSKKAKVFLKEVKNPSDYGILEMHENGSPRIIVEKPTVSSSNLAVTGLYFYPNEAIEMASVLKPSIRGETEITDLNNEFLKIFKLDCEILPRSTVWFDTGTFEGIHSASEFVRVIEEQLGLRIGDPFEVAKTYNWI